MQDDAPTIEHTRPRSPVSVRRLAILCGLGLLAVLASTQLSPRLLFPPTPPAAEVIPQEPAPPVEAEALAPPVFSPPPDATPVEPTPIAAAEPAPAQTEEKPSLSAETVRMLDAQLRDHAKQLGQLKAQQDAAWRTVVLLNAYDRLKDAALSGKPFPQEYAQMAQLTETSQEAGAALKPLEPFAAHGIPQPPFLKASFEASVKRALAPEITAKEGFFARLKANFSKLITIRKIGDLPGNSPESVIARAEMALSRDDIGTAATEIQTMTGSPAKAFVGWLTHARAHLALGPSMAALKSSILAAEHPADSAAEAPQ